jgi:hypothetical protein
MGWVEVVKSSEGSMARVVMPVDISRARVLASSRFDSVAWVEMVGLGRRMMVGRRTRTSISSRKFWGMVTALERLEGSRSSWMLGGGGGAVSDRPGDCARLDTPLRSPLILS